MFNVTKILLQILRWVDQNWYWYIGEDMSGIRLGKFLPSEDNHK